MQTAPLATSDTPTLPGMLLPARPTYLAAPRARYGWRRRSLAARLLIDLALLARLAFLVAEGLLAVRVVLALLGGNPAASFSALIYGATGPLVAPFTDVFPGTLIVGGQTVDATAILAIIVYWILARLVESVLRTLAQL